MKLSVRLDVYERAACAGIDPAFFDSWQGVDVDTALIFCSRCPVRRGCEDVVRPRKSFFTGVAGGKVWHEGTRLIKNDGAWTKAVN